METFCLMHDFLDAVEICCKLLVRIRRSIYSKTRRLERG